MSEISSEEHGSSVGPAAVVVKEPVGHKEEEPSQMGVSFFITKKQREDLRARGYEDAAIDKMTPSDAHRILGIV